MLYTSFKYTNFIHVFFFIKIIKKIEFYHEKLLKFTFLKKNQTLKIEIKNCANYTFDFLLK